MNRNIISTIVITNTVTTVVVVVNFIVIIISKFLFKSLYEQFIALKHNFKNDQNQTFCQEQNFMTNQIISKENTKQLLK